MRKMNKSLIQSFIFCFLYSWFEKNCNAYYQVTMHREKGLLDKFRGSKIDRDVVFR